jgi:hypothetical protein
MGLLARVGIANPIRMVQRPDLGREKPVDCERLTLRSLVRSSAKHRLDVTMKHAERVLLRALRKLDPSRDWENSPFAEESDVEFYGNSG